MKYPVGTILINTENNERREILTRSLTHYTLSVGAYDSFLCTVALAESPYYRVSEESVIDQVLNKYIN